MPIFQLNHIFGLAFALTLLSPKSSVMDWVVGFIFVVGVGFLQLKAAGWILGTPEGNKDEFLSKWASLQAGREVIVLDAPGSHANGFILNQSGRVFVLLTEGLRKKLTQKEKMGIVAHELGYLKLNHQPKLKYSTLLVDVVWWFSMCGIGLLWKSNAPVFNVEMFDESVAIWLGLPLIWLAWFKLRTEFLLWLSRRFEFQADAFSKTLVGSELLAEALKQLTGAKQPLWEREPFFWGATHPPVEARLKRLVSY